MRDPSHCAAELDVALRQLTDSVGALRQALAASRLAFVRTKGTELEARSREHATLAEAVHGLEGVVGSRRSELCRALGVPESARMSALLARLPAAVGKRLGETAELLRAALQALRVESAVGRRLLDVSRRAQEGLLQGLGAAGTRQPTHRYDRHARTVQSRHAGGIVRGTV